jgi:hypothetical protein
MRDERTAAPGRVRMAACETCGERVPAGSRVAGECPECAGLVPLDLRGADGRFLSFRDLFSTRVALRLSEGPQVDMVLGDGGVS